MCSTARPTTVEEREQRDEQRLPVTDLLVFCGGSATFQEVKPTVWGYGCLKYLYMQTIEKNNAGERRREAGRPLKGGCHNPSWVSLINDGNPNWVMEGIKVESAATAIKIQVNERINEPPGRLWIL